jgi:hypothetical protein
VIPFNPPVLRELAQEPTAREIEVLQLVADGLVNREIGQRLFLSEETVKSHVRHLLAKLQARSRAHGWFSQSWLPRWRDARRSNEPTRWVRVLPVSNATNEEDIQQSPHVGAPVFGN